jgi:hypothetical protein
MSLDEIYYTDVVTPLIAANSWSAAVNKSNFDKIQVFN